MLSTLELSLLVAALLAGITGTWSPCGLSMIATIGPSGHSGGPRTTVASCATFAVGAIAGGTVTFAGLASLGSLARIGGDGLALALAAALAIAAALGEAGGVRVVPQVRRQVPEHWRRVMPLALAAALYGLLLGLGFTTFVLTLAVWALALISVAIGDPLLGGLVGVAFGAGRALPVIAIAPLADRRTGVRLTELMAERPAALRGLRLADGVALALCAVTLVTTDAVAATTVAAGATDPTVAGTSFAWDRPGGNALLQRGDEITALPGTSAALGGPFLAWRSGDDVTLARRATLAPVATIALRAVNELSVSARWLVYRVRGVGGTDQLLARPIGAAIGEPRLIGSARAPEQLGRPSIDGDIVVFHVAGRHESRIVQVDLRSGRRRTLRRARDRQLLNPAVLGNSLLYVSASSCAQQLRLGGRGRGRSADRLLLEIPAIAQHDSGYQRGYSRQGRFPAGCESPRPGPQRRTTLWTTALSRRAAYVTRLRAQANAPSARIVRVSR